jgi:hypothetical protein
VSEKLLVQSFVPIDNEQACHEQVEVLDTSEQ